MLTCKRSEIPYGRSAEQGITMHDFRRSAKTYMTRAGVEKPFRDVILGHSLDGMDRHYIKPTEEMLSGAMDKYTRWLDSQIDAYRKNVAQSVAQMHVA